MTYRPEVQILRGLAVLIVVLFHLEVPAFSSGFLGVDVFFVISGYLMAVLFDPAAPGQFFLRRARRLLPAYFATLLATVLAVVLFTTPNEFNQFASQIAHALGFTANIGYWARDSYWAKGDFKPLLHFWSLAVEIQFYLLVPLVALLVRRAGLIGLAVLAVASALLCFSLAPIHPEAAFYLLPMRMWEFLIGFGLGSALGHRTIGGARAGRAGLVALAAIVLISFLPSVEGGGFLLGHPGFASLAITIATAVVIAAGLPAVALGSAPARCLERLGDWSYSIYLAHFPVIVLMLSQPFRGTITQSPTPGRFALVIVTVVLASALLYRLIEKPLRAVRFHWPSLATALVAISLVALFAPGWQKAPMSEAERTLFASLKDRDRYRCGPTWPVLHPLARTCPLNQPDNPQGKVFLVGNSYADSLKQTLTRIASRHGFQVFLTVENKPLMPEGRLRVDDIIGEALALDATTIVMHYSEEAVDSDVIEAVAAAAAAHGIVTRFIMPVPRQPDNVPRSLLHALQTGEQPARIAIDDYRRHHAGQLARLKQIEVPGFRVYEVAQDLCQPLCEIADAHGALFYYDEHHLTLTGSRQLEPTLEQVVSDAVANTGAGPGLAHDSHGHPLRRDGAPPNTAIPGAAAG